jgi:hypothetical protein
MGKCVDCPNKLDVYLIWANSFFGVCENCLIKRLQDFHLFSSKFDRHPPIIIPKEFIDIPKKSYWFPQIIIRFGEMDTSYGKTLEEFKKWQEKALASVEFNIP